ncbi:MAG: peptide ABC transporter substrate-binding protein [Synechococcales bacterium]|nr:peptide ABC transporter substrate-binding protein [Synechococcales bacterium]
MILRSPTHQFTPLTLAICLLLTTACNTGPSSSESASPESATDTAAAPDADSRILRLLYWQAPTILNPHLSTGIKDAEASRITLEPLASFDKDNNLVPFLAAEEPTLENGGLSEDGRTVTWKLKEGVAWSDGTPFTAADVVFTYNFLTNPEVGATTASDYETIESVEALDDHTVRVTFKEPNPAWFLVFVGPGGMILPQHIFENYNGANVRQAPGNLMPVGTGPYRVVEFKPGDVIVYERNPNYRDAEAIAFDRIELKGGGDATSAARAVLQTGDADFAYNLQVEAQVLSQLKGTGQVLSLYGALMERLLLNQTDPNQQTADGAKSTLQFAHPFLTDPQVRQAINLAIDRDTIATQLYGPTGKATANVVVAPEQFVSPNTAYEFNPDAAAQLLDQAGWVDSNGNGIRDKNGVEMQMVFQTSVNPLRQKTQEIIKQNLEAIGMAVELKSIDASIFFSGDPANADTTEKFQADLQMYTTGNNNPDPGDYLQAFTCREIPQPDNNWLGYNAARYCNPKYDALWQQSSIELDPTKRQELFVQMNDMLVEDAVILPLVHRAEVVGVSDRLSGVELTPWEQYTWNIADWRKD